MTNLRSCCRLIWVVLLGVATPLAADPAFRDLSDTLPVTHVYAGGWEHFVGGGVAVFDCDSNGFPDLYVAGGDNPARLLRNTTPSAGAPLSFDFPEPPGLGLTGVTGAYPLDIDGDGHLDLFVMRVGANAVFRGLGNCQFEPADAAWTIAPGAGWTTAFSATWEGAAARPTFAVGNYVDRADPNGPFGACDTHQLFRPGGDGYLPPETIAPGFCTLSMLFTDWRGSGQQDLWISNDRHYYVTEGREQLFRVSPVLQEYGDGDGWLTQKLWGMGIASRDITGDGAPEIAVTSMADQKLYSLTTSDGAPTYQSIAWPRGTTAQLPYIGDEGRPSTGWHVQFGDVDNDGRDDLFIAKGNVDQMPDSAMADPDNLLMQQPDGIFLEYGDGAGVGSTARGRGAAVTDLNRDGLLDLVVVQRRAPLKLYQNVTTGAGNWLKLRLEQAAGNRHAVGAKIEVQADGVSALREVQVGGGHAGGQAGFAHFGLGAATSARVRVIWPDGTAGPWASAEVNGHGVIARAGEIETVTWDGPKY
ncbi:CRTAC1 family protein [Pseudoruegeria sp. SK021]|uniref:CRTAC1 family protein n=1 Tax=Pseudoruegeria sp. SK021 TaxID=1933035 RepID=UPI000A2366D1|nr:CRTAC1 family protein [Pseudoruegeria sp. SK021]OSP54030.1 hypothetical protein BV911_14540 [Pseudoruegeria sp. SK021]